MSTSSLAVVEPPRNLPVFVFQADEIDLIKRTIAKGATDDELKLFLYQCERTGLNPLAKQIYFQKRRSRGEDTLVILTGIDGYRLIADRTGQYAGNDDPVFDDEDNPGKATVTVYKMVGGVRCAYTASARWAQYYPGDQLGFMWRKMPHLMLGKCAEALALRKAFPAELSGVHVKEEMEQAARDDEREEQREDLHAALAQTFPVEQPKPTPPPVQQGPAKFDIANPKHKAWLKAALAKEKVPQHLWPTIEQRMQGRPVTDARAVTTDAIKHDNVIDAFDAPL